MRCIRPTDFAKICISSKTPRGLPIHRLEVQHQFFVHANLNKTNRIKENNIFLKKVTVLTYLVTGPIKEYMHIYAAKPRNSFGRMF